MESPLTFDFPIYDFLALGFYLMMMFYIIFSAVLYYHWDKYSVDPKVTRITYIFYLVTTVPLMTILGIVTLII